MTNLLVSILITTNSHWTTIRTEASYTNCNVLGCGKDHSEKRTEEQSLHRITEAEIIFEGRTNRVVLRSDPIPIKKPATRVLYSGFDYEKPRLQWAAVTNLNWTLGR